MSHPNIICIFSDQQRYNTAAADIARGLDIVVNDLFVAITSAGCDNLLLPDGVHFKPEGYALLGKGVAAQIKSVADELPNQAVEATS
jgi:lysophospholipase L1-like esterase